MVPGTVHESEMVSELPDEPEVLQLTPTQPAELSAGVTDAHASAENCDREVPDGRLKGPNGPLVDVPGTVAQ